METLHITEEELIRDVRAVLSRVRAGAEIIVGDGTADVVLRPAVPARRKLSEVMASISSGCRGIDKEYAADIQAAIDSRREPLDPPAWD